MQDALQRITTGALKRLIIVCPPRHGKTEQGTVRYPVYRLMCNPTQRVILAAYNATLARKFSRKARRIARQIGMALDTERNAVEDWETQAGGGVRAVGVGEGITGQGANLIIIDDPVKSREEAESEVYRNKTYDWYTDDLYSRLEPGAAIVLTMTRWHEDDLVGRILASDDKEDWEVIRLPALAEEHDPLGRPVGAALCPERFDEAALAAIQRVQTAYAFSALYQGRPTPHTGNMFPEDRVTIVDALPAGLKMVRYWDNAGTAGGDGARTAGVKMGCYQGRYFVADCTAFREEEAARDRRQRLTAEQDGQGVTQWLEQEPGSAGKAQKAVFIRFMAPYPAHAEPASGDKVVRAEGWAAQWQAGNVSLLRGDWTKAYIAEHASFPNGRTKDQVDASSGAFHKVATQRTIVGPLADLVKESHWSL